MKFKTIRTLVATIAAVAFLTGYRKSEKESHEQK